jgi:DNA polymerase III subunit chi
MTQIDFYILPQSEREARFAFACRLIEKAHALGHRIYVHAETETDVQALDELLWSYRPASFLPHAVLSHTREGSGEGEARPNIEIGSGDDAGDHHDVLINLALKVPPFHSRFTRVTEIVVQDEQVLQATRASWKFYSEHGFPMQRHDMRPAVRR